MKFVGVAILVVCLAYSAAGQTYEETLMKHREEMNAEFRNPTTTILDSLELPHFDSIAYYAPDLAFRIPARFRKKLFRPTFEMATTTARKPVYRKYGILTFEVAGKRHKLVVYQNVDLSKKVGYENYLFCPFKDLTNGLETYGGGRYLDFKMDELASSPIIDFNYAYNPYCSYNYKYSCPLPPSENWLNLRIEAGVKAYQQAAH